MQNRVTDLTQQVNSDKALIAQVNALLSEGQDDAGIVNQDITALDSTVNQLLREGFGEAADSLINRARVNILNALDPRAEQINEALANNFFKSAAAAEGEEAAAAGEIIDLLSANLVEVLGLPALAAMYAEAGKIGTADAALGLVLAQLSPLQDQYHQAETQIGTLEARLDAATEELNSDNADVSTLTNQVDAAQAADQAALNAMTSTCQSATAG